jgi:serine/threonine-protein kinase RsbT
LLEQGLSVFCRDVARRERCLSEIRSAVALKPPTTRAASLEIPVASEDHIVNARSAARSMAIEIGFGNVDQSKIATAVSELARNICRYASSGSVRLAPVSVPRSGMRIVAQDQGPGIPNLPEILAGRYKSRTGMGLGILGCRRLMDEFHIESAPRRGTCVTLTKYLRGVG